MGVTGKKLGDITGVTSSQMSQAPRGSLAYGEAQGLVVPSGTKGGKDSVRGLERPSWGRWDGGRALKSLPVDVGVSGRRCIRLGNSVGRYLEAEKLQYVWRSGCGSARQGWWESGVKGGREWRTMKAADKGAAREAADSGEGGQEGSLL